MTMCGRIDIQPNNINEAVEAGFGVDWDTKENRDLRPTQLVDALLSTSAGLQKAENIHLERVLK